MDPFTQRMLEKAEQRSRALGVCNVDANAAAAMAPALPVATTPMAMSTVMAATPTPKKLPAPKPPVHITNKPDSMLIGGNTNKLQVVEKTPPVDASSSSVSSPAKVLRQFSAVDKENMDLGIEINIMTDKNIEVQVQVEEQEVTDDDEEQRPQMQRGELVNQPLAKLRDTSRNRLQRLGALYSNTDDLSSPIHRTEGQFHADSSDDINLDASPRKPRQRYGKLAALATTINQWEDDTSHHPLPKTEPPPKPDLPSRKLMDSAKKAPAPQPPSSPAPPKAPKVAICTRTNDENISASATVTTTNNNNNKTKQLKWDPKVINSLEAQGFQRRESSTIKLAYDYKGEVGGRERDDEPTAEKTSAVAAAVAAVVAETSKLPTVKPGLVSGRAAVFESKANAAAYPPQRPQKDPTELSLKERMQLFEKNKGEALVPKAAFGMAPSISKIRQDITKATYAAPVAPLTAAVLVKPRAEGKVRDKVAALVTGANTISEHNIKTEIQKQRQEEMQLLANRFHKPKDIFTKAQQGAEKQIEVEHQVETSKTAQPKTTVKSSAVYAPSCPPPPPPPPVTAPLLSSAKRRSPGNAIDEESKRAKTATVSAVRTAAMANRLYPALSGLESNESLDNEDNYATTATVSGRSTADEVLNDAPMCRDEPEEDNDSYMESEPDADDSSAGICNGSLGREIMHVVKQNDQHQRHAKQTKEVHYAEKNHYYGGGGGDSSINSSEASMGIDDYLDEALEDNVEDGDDDYTQGSDDDDDDDNNGNINSSSTRKSNGTTTSNSFSFRKTPKKYTNCEAIYEEGREDYQMTQVNSAPVRSELSVNREDENMVTLVHTVSFYRRQQKTNSASSTPVRKVSREQQMVHRSAVESMAYDSPTAMHSPCRDTADYSEDDMVDDAASDEADDGHLVQDKIKKLLDEVCKQQQVIGQTSQALNLCAATIEFSGSTESVEAERHLLVATHRRQACLDEVQRLRVEKTLRPLCAPKEKGRLTVKEITIPLRQNYIRKLAADTISGHHLVCLLKYNEHVLATKSVPTLPGLLAVKFPDVLQLNNVYADFRISLEIYGMTAQREVLPHEIKYHINVNKKPGVKTPKKKGGDNRLVMPPVQSPAGPNAVRTSTLVQYGYAIFSLREIQRTSWSLTQVLGISPLDGVVHMKVNCELSVSVEHKGFLTMFEDTSGIGAWHRRWCYLNGSVLNYWKYPEDERKKTPIGSIDLYECTTQKVTVAPRDICARLNTMLLECQRPARDSDKESLVIVPNGCTTIVRHLLTADTKEEREEWCAYFNKALTLLRAWGPVPQ